MTDLNYIKMIQGVYFAMTVRQLQNLLIAKNFSIPFSHNIDRKGFAQTNNYSNDFGKT